MTSRGMAQAARPAHLPASENPALIESATAAKITAFTSRPPLEVRIGETIQAGLASIAFDDLRTHRSGLIITGGSSPPPCAPDRALPRPWAATSRAFAAVAVEQRPDHVARTPAAHVG